MREHNVEFNFKINRLLRNLSCDFARICALEFSGLYPGGNMNRKFRPRRDGTSAGYTAAKCRYDVTKSSRGISFCRIYPASIANYSRGIARVRFSRPGICILFERFKHIERLCVGHITFIVKTSLWKLMRQSRDSFGIDERWEEYLASWNLMVLRDAIVARE